ncbi:MAG: F0F1 ATP synthase subunit B [Candidatus Latescibacteria bacterium]|nr:F0F1 ATP synthase subunit B [Candidatus Latescibacterota bacterium]
MININLTTVFTILNFVFLIYILKAILFKPLTKFLDDRAKTIEESLRLAEENRQRAEDMKTEHDQIIMEARTKASEIIDSAMVNASKESREVLAEAREKAQVTVDSAKEEIMMEAERIKQDLRREVAAMSVSLAGKVLSREIREEDHKELISKSLDVMGHRN